MILDAILDQPAIPWLATEGDKWAHFIRTFGTALTVEWLPQLRFGDPPHVTVRYFPDRQPIGIVEPGETYTFLYLATKPSTVDLHAFLQRHAELLRTVPKWTVRVLLPPHLCKAQAPYLRALRLELGTRMAPGMADECRWWCRARRAAAQIGGQGHHGPSRLPGSARSTSRGACSVTTSSTVRSLPSSRTRWSAAPGASNARCLRVPTCISPPWSARHDGTLMSLARGSHRGS